MARALGRITPPDFNHVLKYPYSLEVHPVNTAVVFGINWYEGFDNPVLGSDGKHRIKISGNIRGGHCLSSEPAPQASLPESGLDNPQWWQFYNQGEEGACVGFGNSRALSLITRHKFDAFWLYDDARRYENAYPSGEGSTVRSGMAVLVKWGDHFQDNLQNCTREKWRGNAPGTGVKSYHWITSAETIRAALGYSSTVGEIPLLNSWGREYPHRVYIDLQDIDRLLSEEGEAGVFVR